MADLCDRQSGVIPVSTVLAAFNGSAFVSAAIRSVLQQRVRPAEIIVVDDGSTDGTADLAESLGARVIRLPRSGVCVARNAGIREATSPWIALMDHDDEWLPHKLERQWAALARFPDAVLLATDVERMDRAGRSLSEPFLHAESRRYDRVEASSREGGFDYFAHIDRDIHLAGWFLLPSTVLVRRDVLLDVGMFDERFFSNEDVSCFLRVLNRGAMVMVDEPLTRWRIHDSNRHLQQLDLLRGRLALTRVAADEPDMYPRGYVDRLVAERPGLLVRIGRGELSAGDPPAARAALAAAVRGGAGNRARLLWLATWLGGRNADRVAALQRRLSGRKPTL
jgi:glycosyltransferase involved in cell wall biosynthesis